VVRSLINPFRLNNGYVYRKVPIDDDAIQVAKDSFIELILVWLNDIEQSYNFPFNELAARVMPKIASRMAMWTFIWQTDIILKVFNIVVAVVLMLCLKTVSTTFFVLTNQYYISYELY